MLYFTKSFTSLHALLHDMLYFTTCFTSPLLPGSHLIKDERLALERGFVSVQKLEPRVPQRPAQKNAENYKRHQLPQKNERKNKKKQ